VRSDVSEVPFSATTVRSVLASNECKGLRASWKSPLVLSPDYVVP
jgi:hypothetical protein